MRIVDAIGQALRSLATNTLRTLLTTLGIVIGVASVIALLSLASGFNELIVSEIRGAGANLVFIFPGGSSSQRGSVFRPGASGTLTLEDARALRAAQIPKLDAVAVDSGDGAVIKLGDCGRQISLAGVDPEEFAISGLELDAGRVFDQREFDLAAPVIVLGSQIVDQLAGIEGSCATLVPGMSAADAETNRPTAAGALLGREVRIDNQVFNVIGLATEMGRSFGGNDGNAYIPLTTMHYRIGSRHTATGEVRVDQITLALADETEQTSDQVTAEVGAVLRARHRVEEDDFQFLSQNQLLEIFAQITLVASIFLGSVGGISLLVGGIGIMNIMLVTVTERTREIGIRKALGARYRDLIAQFLIESVFLSVLGGAIGVGFGWLIAFGVSQIPIDNGDPIPTLVTPQSVVLALAVASGIGLIFGLYPANRAARLNPIEALRYE